MSVSLADCVILDTTRKCIYLLHCNKKGITQWELPGGKVELDEDVEYAAIRELREELGVDIKIVKKLGETSFDEHNIEYTYVWFLAKVRTGQLSLCEPETFDDLKSFSLNEMTNLELSGNMKKLYAAIVTGQVTLE